MYLIYIISFFIIHILMPLFLTDQKNVMPLYILQSDVSHVCCVEIRENKLFSLWFGSITAEPHEWGCLPTLISSSLIGKSAEGVQGSV